MNSMVRLGDPRTNFPWRDFSKHVENEALKVKLTFPWMICGKHWAPKDVQCILCNFVTVETISDATWSNNKSGIDLTFGNQYGADWFLNRSVQKKKRYYLLKKSLLRDHVLLRDSQILNQASSQCVQAHTDGCFCFASVWHAAHKLTLEPFKEGLQIHALFMPT